MEDILRAIERIESEAASGRKNFDADQKVQVWMLHHLRIVGEAVRSISDELKVLEPTVPWGQIVGMRHILVHDYFGVDIDEVWNAVEKDVPELKKTILRLLAELPEQA